MRCPLPSFTITVDGRPGDIEDLYLVLTRSRLPGGVELSATSSRDGTLGVVDTIAAAVASVAALGSLVVSIAQWKAMVKASVRIDLGGGKGIELGNADPETIERVWAMIEQQQAQERK
jgi:hypothetical protein